MRFPWYLASILSSAAFPLFAIIATRLWDTIDPDFDQQTAGLGTIGILPIVSAIAFVGSLALSTLLSRDKKLLAFAGTFLLIVVLAAAILIVPAPG